MCCKFVMSSRSHCKVHHTGWQDALHMRRLLSLTLAEGWQENRGYENSRTQGLEYGMVLLSGARVLRILPKLISCMIALSEMDYPIAVSLGRKLGYC